MTTKPTKPSPSEFYRHCIRNGHTEMRALTEVLLTYLDEQHPAVAPQVWNGDRRGSWLETHTPSVITESTPSVLDIDDAPATPETGERAERWADFQPPPLREQPSFDAALAKLKAMTPEEVFESSVRAGIHNPDGTLTERYRDPLEVTPETGERAPSPEPAPGSRGLLGEREQANQWLANWHDTEKALASANARAEALESQLATAEAQLVSERRAQCDDMDKLESALAEANARYERSQAQTDDYERTLEAERRHTALLTQELAEARYQFASEQAAHAVTRQMKDLLVAQKQCTQCLAALPASPSAPAPVAPTDLCRCSWPAPPLGPHHSVECPLFRAGGASDTSEGRKP